MKVLDDAKTVCVCGAGHQGLSMAAHLSINGVHVNLWNRTQQNIQKIIDTNTIHCNGVFNGDASISIASTNISEVITDFILVTTPSTAHKDVASVIAPYVNKDSVIILNPGRTFGAIEFAEELRKNGVKEMPQIAETQTIVYTCRKTGCNSTTILAMKNDVDIAAIRGSDIDNILDRMPCCLKPFFRKANSVGFTSLSNVGMILHCAPVLMNIGWIEAEKVDFKYYYDGISPTIAQLLERMDSERLTVADAFGYEVESVVAWMNRTYSLESADLFGCIRNNKAYREIDAPPTINTRYIFEDVPNGLVPLEAIAIEVGIQTPIISTIIDLACEVMGVDYRKTG